MRWETYEVWALVDGRWSLVAWFRDFDVAQAVAARRGGALRLVHVTYDDNQVLSRDTLAEIGVTREHP